MQLKTKKIICSILILTFVFLPLVLVVAFVFYLRSGRFKRDMANALGERTDKLVDIKAVRLLGPTDIILKGVKFLAPRNPGPEELVRAVFTADTIKLNLGLSGFRPFWKEAEVDGPSFKLYGPEFLGKDFRFIEKLLGPRPRRVIFRGGILSLSWCHNLSVGERPFHPSIQLENARGHLKWDGLGKMTLALTGKEGFALVEPPVHLRGYMQKSSGALESDFVIRSKRLSVGIGFLEMSLPKDIFPLVGVALDGEVHLSSRGVTGKAVIKGGLRASDLQEVLRALGLSGIGGPVEAEIKGLVVEGHRVTQFQAQVCGEKKGKLDAQTAWDLNFLFSGERSVIPEDVREFTYDRLGLSISCDGQRITFRGLVDEEGRTAVGSLVNGGLIPLVKVSPEPILVDLLRERWQEIKQAAEICQEQTREESDLP